MNHYERLGIAMNASSDAIRASYRRRARAVHPDTTGSADDAEMRAINEAWFVLSDPDRRHRYDEAIMTLSSQDAVEPNEVTERADDRPDPRAAQTLGRMITAAIVLAAVATALLILIALLEGH